MSNIERSGLTSMSLITSVPTSSADPNSTHVSIFNGRNRNLVLIPILVVAGLLVLLLLGLLGAYYGRYRAKRAQRQRDTEQGYAHESGFATVPIKFMIMPERALVPQEGTQRRSEGWLYTLDNVNIG